MKSTVEPMTPAPHPIVCCHEPNFVPHIGFFDKLAKSDIWIMMDEVQYVQRFMNRNRIKRLKDGQVTWLTIPIERFRLGDRIAQIHVSGKEWKIKHKRILQANYNKAPFFSDYFPSFVEHVYDIQSDLLIDYNIASIDFFVSLFGIQTKVIRMTELGVDRSLRKTDLLVAMVKAVGGSTYLSGEGASRAYLDEQRFPKEHLTLFWQSFRHPTYRQLGNDFIPHLSILDYAFNVGNMTWYSSP